jgi:2-polyprenyl-6-methoxyphenol hydroxylase-like FAD-dependent oxidoreductase
MIDVLVVGGGPTGMTLAGDLARLGSTAVVLERWPTLNPSSRAFVTMPRTLEVLDCRGLADPLLALGHTTSAVRLFGGATLDLTQLRPRYRFGHHSADEHRSGPRPLRGSTRREDSARARGRSARVEARCRFRRRR